MSGADHGPARGVARRRDRDRALEPSLVGRGGGRRGDRPGLPGRARRRSPADVALARGRSAAPSWPSRCSRPASRSSSRACRTTTTTRSWTRSCSRSRAWASRALGRDGGTRRRRDAATRVAARLRASRRGALAIVLVAIAVTAWPPAVSPDGGWPLVDRAAARVLGTTGLGPLLARRHPVLQERQRPRASRWSGAGRPSSGTRRRRLAPGRRRVRPAVRDRGRRRVRAGRPSRPGSMPARARCRPLSSTTGSAPAAPRDLGLPGAVAASRRRVIVRGPARARRTTFTWRLFAPRRPSCALADTCHVYVGPQGHERGPSGPPEPRNAAG